MSTLPSAPARHAPLWRERHDAPTFAAASAPQPRVLVVEDDPVQALLLTLMLGHLGVACTLVSDGARALQAVRCGDPYALVFMDYRMPLVDGAAATRAIRDWEAANGRTPLPIIAVTASAMAAEQQACVDAGMNDVILKPFSAQSLAEVLARHGMACPLSALLPGVTA